MDREPLAGIGVVFGSIKLAVTTVVGVLVIAANLPEGLGQQVILASGLVILAIGDIVQFWLTRPRVTSVVDPRLPVGTPVNRGIPGPDATVVEDPA